MPECMPLILPLGRPRQEDGELEASLDNKTRLYLKGGGKEGRWGEGSTNKIGMLIFFWGFWKISRDLGVCLHSFCGS